MLVFACHGSFKHLTFDLHNPWSGYVRYRNKEKRGRLENRGAKDGVAEGIVPVGVTDPLGRRPACAALRHRRTRNTKEIIILRRFVPLLGKSLNTLVTFYIV